jgi:hypothetical protein
MRKGRERAQMPEAEYRVKVDYIGPADRDENHCDAPHEITVGVNPAARFGSGRVSINGKPYDKAEGIDYEYESPNPADPRLKRIEINYREAGEGGPEVHKISGEVTRADDAGYLTNTPNGRRIEAEGLFNVGRHAHAISRGKVMDRDGFAIPVTPDVAEAAKTADTFARSLEVLKEMQKEMQKLRPPPGEV